MSKRRLYTKMDARFKGYPDWQYFIARPERNNRFFNTPTRYESMQIFFQWRRWCWETWGASKELVDWLDDYITRPLGPPNLIAVDHNPNWCWVNDPHNTRIYLRTDAELTLFLLKWA